MIVNILGTEWSINEMTEEQDSYLARCDGYADKTSKKIVIKAKDDSNELEDFGVYQKKVMRHEIIHAFLYESGLQENYKKEEWGHDETMVDWFAIQFPKILEVYKCVGCV